MDQTFDDLVITQKDLLMVPEGKITEEGFRLNVETAVQYTQEWLCESGCVPLNNLMEDANPQKFRGSNMAVDKA